MSFDFKPPSSRAQLERIEKLIASGASVAPILELIGFRITEVALGRAVTQMPASRRHANAMGTLHGGVICDLADAAMGTAMATTLEPDETFTTLDLNAKYFKPVWEAALQASAQVTKRTRTLGLVECEVTDERGSVVAKVFSTCMVLRGDEAKGR